MDDVNYLTGSLIFTCPKCKMQAPINFDMYSSECMGSHDCGDPYECTGCGTVVEINISLEGV